MDLTPTGTLHVFELLTQLWSLIRVLPPHWEQQTPKSWLHFNFGTCHITNLPHHKPEPSWGFLSPSIDWHNYIQTAVLTPNPKPVMCSSCWILWPFCLLTPLIRVIPVAWTHHRWVSPISKLLFWFLSQKGKGFAQQQ